VIRLYQASGSWEIRLLAPHFTDEEWAKFREHVRRLLSARKHTLAVSLLEKTPLKLYDGTNVFGDVFTVLRAEVDLDQYTRVAEAAEKDDVKKAAAQLAHTVTEIGPYARFVVVVLDTEKGPEPVSTPSLLISSASVERALEDATQLMTGTGPANAVDRVHTAMLGYLRAACERVGIEYLPDATLAVLFKLIRQQHAAFSGDGPRAEDIRKIANSLGAILDALNPLRNQASGAHPNEELLNDAEAMLVINTVRTLLHYLDAKLG
jgi:hypothetical protein